jgi:hypothetical protein
MRRFVLVTIAVLAPCACGIADDDSWLSRSGYFRVSFESELDPIVINRIHTWTFQVTTPEGEPVLGAQMTATGGMPEHNHGLPTDPQMTAELGDGRYRFEGFRFHMNGDWELFVTIDVAGRRDTVVIPLTI